MFPIVTGIAATFGTDWQPFIVVMMLGCSYAFINPAGFQTHLMVMKPGRYTFADFAKVGIPLTLVLGVVVVTLALVLYPGPKLAVGDGAAWLSGDRPPARRASRGAC